MTEASRCKAIEAYTAHIRHYALMGMWRALRNAKEADRIGVPSTGWLPRDALWAHQLSVLKEEFGSVLPPIAELGDKLVDSATQQARDAERAKDRDASRGRRVIDDYDDVHALPENEETVQVAQRFAVTIASELHTLIPIVQRRQPKL